MDQNTHGSTDSFEGRRNLYLQQARHMIAVTDHAPWSVCMQHNVKDLEKISTLCIDAANDMGSCLSEAIEKLEQGHDISTICDPSALPYYTRPDYCQTPCGGAASAIGDVSLLIASIDPTPFSVHANGTVQKDVMSFLNSTLHIWLLKLQKEWSMISPEIGATHDLFQKPLPCADGEKATLRNMFRALCHSLHIGPERPSPFINQPAQNFARIFSAKLWPQGITGTEVKPEQGCILSEVSIAFQEWYFSVGKTQTEDRTPQAERRACDIFASLREEFHSRGRTCAASGGKDCTGSCVQDSFQSLPDDPFKNRCSAAVRYIVLHMKKD